MTETHETPQAGIAEALNDLSDQTRVLADVPAMAKFAAEPSGQTGRTRAVGRLAASNRTRLRGKPETKRVTPP